MAAGAVYIRLRWRRAPQAYRAMVAVAGGYLIAGAVLGGWIVHRVMLPSSTAVATKSPSVSNPAVAMPELPNRFFATVVGIMDGDTIVVADSAGRQESVRLSGIDAPEHDQAFGAQSTQYIASLVSGRNVTLECENERSYGRMICKVLLPTGEDACLDQLKAGMAWHYKQYEDEQSATDRDAYAATECAAMKSKIGLWSDPHPVQPQDFRHGTNSPLLLDAKGCRKSSEPTSGPVVGSARSHIFEWPGCPYYSAISPDNRVEFASPQAAEAAGYRPAHNCP
jgi:endonuclease YncB( thermonuclease family)